MACFPFQEIALSQGSGCRVGIMMPFSLSDTLYLELNAQLEKEGPRYS